MFFDLLIKSQISWLTNAIIYVPVLRPSYDLAGFSNISPILIALFIV
jgi:hypothetical protein